MKSDCFNDLKELILQLKLGEVQVAGKFIVAFDSGTNSGKNKSLQLYHLITEKPAICREEAKQKISKNITEQSFNKLILRVKHKVLESLILDINIHKKGAYSDWFTFRMDLRKKFMEAFILLGRGVEKESFTLLDKIVTKAKEYELYDELYEVLHWLRNEKGLRYGKKEYDAYTPEIEFYSRCRNACYKARDLYFKHFIENVDQQGQKCRNVTQLQAVIEDLEKEYRDTKSVNVAYYMYFLTMEYYMAQCKYKESIRVGYQLVELIEKHPAIYMKLRHGVVYSDLADNEQFVFNFKASLDHAAIARVHINPKSYSFEVVREIEFRAHFYQNNINEAEQIIDDLLGREKYKSSTFLRSKQMYFKSCVLFLKKAYKASYRLLQDAREIEKDKEGWNLGIRLLNIMNLVELKWYDAADKQIEALRKYIDRIELNRPVRKRDKVILKILIQLEKNSFNFMETYLKLTTCFDQLNGSDEELRWEVKSPEMILFQQWFKSHVTSVEYRFEVPASLLSVEQYSEVEYLSENAQYSSGEEELGLSINT
jgi:hypothetical protein